MKQRIAFALPGSLQRITGGTIFDRRVVEHLQLLGYEVDVIELPGSFPNPTISDMEHSLEQLASVPTDTVLIIDGLAFGALETSGLEQVQAPLVALIHHPLAEEAGLSTEKKTRLFNTELQNLKRSKLVIAPSQHTAGLLSKNYAVNTNRITVAHPGADLPTITLEPADPPLILSVGIYMPRKGHDILIQALAQLQDVQWQAVIAGTPIDPEFEGKMRSLVSANNLSERVVLKGQSEKSELEKLYAQATVFALATRYEGYGIVFNEALSHGLPIVSCATGAVFDTVPKEAGILVPPENPDAFADALRALLTNDDKRQELRNAAIIAGETLPRWSDTAQTIASAITKLAVHR
ncbi:MAG: glycosyltransferase family 4 protein [Pseudomonadota bacterium]